MKEWYLMQKPTMTSGDESDILEEFGQDAIEELLESGAGEEVLLCNYDLSETKEIKALIIGNAQETKLKSFNRQIITPIGTIKPFSYVKRNDIYWLIIGIIDSNRIYEKAVMTMCNYYLTWVNFDGNIVQRWASLSSASQYNNGETGQQYYRVRSDQLLAAVPDDKEGISVDTGIRFIVDRRCKVYESEMPEDTEVLTGKKLLVYEATRSSNALYDYQTHGYTEFMMSQDEQRETDGYYKINGKGYWLAGTPNTQTETDITVSNIVPIQDTLYIGVEPASFSAVFKNENGEEDATITPNWTINCDFADKLNVEYVGNLIMIDTDFSSLSNKSFELSLGADGYTTTTVIVSIKMLF